MSLYADSSENAALVVPSDTVNLSSPCNKLFVGTAGNIQVTTQGGQTLVISGVLAGATLSIRCSRVWATLTTASGIVALW